MPSSVDPGALERLLQLQDTDTAIKRRTEERAGLPEVARLGEVGDLQAELEADLEIAAKQRDETAREQSRLEGEIELLGGKIAREEQRMFSGSVANPKELSSLQAEVEMLKRRRSSLEDELLEVMVQSESAVATLESLTSEHENVSRERAELERVVAARTGEIDAELARHSAARTETAAELPGDLLELYEKLRAAKGGIGAARLEEGTCQGCHTKLSAREAERLRAERGLQRCENCRRILVVI